MNTSDWSDIPDLIIFELLTPATQTVRCLLDVFRIEDF